MVHVVATRNFAGVERYITYVAPHLTAAGWKVTVIGGDPAPMHEALHPAGVHHVPYEGFTALVRQLRRTPATLIHAHMTNAEFASVLAVGRRTPIVATRHFAAPRGSTAPARLVGKWISRHLRIQVSISEFVAAHAGEPTIVIPNGVPNRELGTHDENVVLMAQRFEAEKQTEVGLRAWALSGLAAHGWSLHLAGRGAAEERLRHLARELGVADSVSFLGFVDDVIDRMDRCGVFLATAPTEPFGLSIAEAMSGGALVVAADGGAHAELLDRPDLKFPVGDAGACSELLRNWCVDVSARRAAGVRLRERQHAVFDATRHTDRLMRVYADACTLPSSVTPRLDE